MLPIQLTAEQFNGYPPLAKRLVTSRITLLQQLPLGFLPLLLRELIAYDWKFPAERIELDHQLEYLGSMSPDQLQKAMSPFAQLRLSPELEQSNWVSAPVQFSERLTAYLWATHQIDAFSAAAVEYVHKLNASRQQSRPPIPRLGIILIGQGVTENKYPLFRKLRPLGVHFKNVNPQNGWEIVLDAVAARVNAHPAPFAHWYIDGGKRAPISATGLTWVDFRSLDGVRAALVEKMRKVMAPGGGGPELLRSMLAQMRPEDVGLNGSGNEAILNRFRISVLTEGSGTQLFSTTFVQWSAREALRRAQPITLLARFAPRQHERSMKELLAGTLENPILDVPGSLIDADMGAYYTRINQERLSGADQARFLVWFENHSEALAIAPSLPRGTESSTATDMRRLLTEVS